LATEQAPARLSATDRVTAFANAYSVPLALGAMMVCSVGVRVLLARSVKTPWILSDEFIYSELAKSIAANGHFMIRDAPAGVYSYLYPVLIAPAWLAGSMHTTYLLAKAINAVLMTLVAVPVYLWTARLAPRPYALAAAGLSLLLPSFFYTGELMTENAFLPAFVLAAFALALVLERPSLWRQGLLVLSLFLTIAVRFQGLVLFAVLPTAVLLKLAFDLLAADGPRWRIVRRNLVPLWPTAAVLVVAGGAYAAYKHAQGLPLKSGLGAYQGFTNGGYSVHAAARWTLYHFAELPLAAGYIPACALVLLLGLALTRPRLLSSADRSFVAVATAATIWLVLEVATFASKNSLRVEERYMFPAAALLLIALAAWLGRGAPRPRLLTVVAAVLPALVLLALPLSRLLNVSLTSDTFGLIPLYRLSTKLSGGEPLVRKLLITGGVLGSLLFAFVPRRYAAPVLVSAVAAFFVLSSYSVHGTIRDYSRNLAAGAGVLTTPTWVDDRVGSHDADVLYGTSPDYFQEAVALWETEFWNRHVRRVYTLGTPEPVAFPETLARFDPKSGRLRSDSATDLPQARYLVTSRGTDLAGSVQGENGPFELSKLRPPPRIATFTSGIYADGWAGSDSSFTDYAPKSAGKIRVIVSRDVWSGPDVPGHVTVSITPTGRGSATQRFVIHAQKSRVVTLATPRRPFTVRVHITPTFSPSQFGSSDVRQLGARISFRRL
jgi:hypothetical protein